MIDDQRTPAQRIQSACTDIAIAWPEMIRTIPAARRFGTIGRSGERIEPIGAHVLDEREDIPHVLRYWTRTVLDESASTDAPASDDVPDLADYLARHADYLATGQRNAEQWGPVALEELEEAATKCIGIASPSAGSDRRLIGLCPACGQRLDATPDRTWVACHCGEVADIRHVRAAGAAAARGTVTPDTLCTAVEAERYGQLLDVKVNRKTLPVWVGRGDLDVVACRIKGRAPLYRWDDVEARATRPSRRTGLAHAG